MADFTGNQIRHTYQRLLQIDDRFGNRYTIQDGTGSLDLDYFNLSGSINLTGSQTITGNLTVTDTVRAKQFIATTVSSSIIYESGSSAFGNSLDDTHTFSGSIYVTGSIDLNGSFTQSGDTSHTGDLTRVGDSTITGDITQTGDITTNGTIEATRGAWGSFFANPQTITQNVIIPGNYNSRIFGPVTVGEGYTLTVFAHSKLEIIDI